MQEELSEKKAEGEELQGMLEARQQELDERVAMVCIMPTWPYQCFIMLVSGL